MHVRPLLISLTFAAIPVAVIAQSHVLAPVTRAPFAVPSAPPALRLPVGGFARATRPLPAGKPEIYFSETFTGEATTPNAWAYGDNACITAGDANTPASSVPACGANAPQDSPGSGALELTPPVDYESGYVLFDVPIRTNGGLSATFDYYSFGSVGTAGDGLAFVLTNGREPIPTQIGGCCGSLGYAQYYARGLSEYPLDHAYVAVGLDESGVFTQTTEGKNGGHNGLSNLLTLRGDARSKAVYLFSTKNAQGNPAPLPFPLSVSSQTRPQPLTFNVTLSAAGVISVSIDRHNGDGPATYIPPTSIVINGQRPLPDKVYVGFTAAGGGANARHQINNVVVTSAPASAFWRR